MQLRHTRKPALLAALLMLLWLWIGITIENGELPQQAVAALNISMLAAMVILIVCVVRILCPRLVMQASEKGLYLKLPPQAKGIVPWRHIGWIEADADGRHVRIYLKGMWDVPDGCGERFAIETDETGKRMLRPDMRRKLGNPQRVSMTLTAWHEEFMDVEKILPDVDEREQRRQAAWKKRGLSTGLAPIYFLRSKFWLLAICGYLLLCDWISKQASFSLPVTLLVGLIPCAPAVWLLRRGLNRLIARLERSRDAAGERKIGL